MSSLFDRMAIEAPIGRQRCRQERAELTVEAIKRHLETLLNARQGCSQSSPELGLRDLNGHDLHSGDLLEQVSADIRRTLRRYEPRIQVRALQGVPDANAPLELHFRLECQVQLNRRTEPLQIDLLVNGHNRYTRVR